ncbi:Holliday junction branch migration protein RuvA [Thermicanus aegyptius]|uniref:Holliday junction branch migration protein RuvA n=1 Tax=Thermicanus aegyptius TaxID=94009 RepID=UPI000405CDB9|nr:Holliday junction branch migration protein RuvA [Thermicanus aegyptius]
MGTLFEYIKGKLTWTDREYVVVEAGGIGYCIFTANPAAVIAREGEEVTLYLHQVIREDAHLLYGFPSREERSMFRHLLGVNGIGPKGALSILSSLSPQQIALAIVQEDVKRLKSLPGIGQKTAQRLILDLKDKLKGGAGDMGPDGGLSGAPPDGNGGGSVKLNEALEALMVLGYHEYEVLPSLRKLYQASPDLPTEEYIRRILAEADGGRSR